MSLLLCCTTLCRAILGSHSEYFRARFSKNWAGAEALKVDGKQLLVERVEPDMVGTDGMQMTVGTWHMACNSSMQQFSRTQSTARLLHRLERCIVSPQSVIVMECMHRSRQLRRW
jgi:hypothetical protein